MNIKPWRTDLKRWLETPAKVTGDTVITASRHHEVRALDASTGEQLWATDVSDQLLDAPKVASEDTVLIQARQNGKGAFYGLDLKDGKVKWSREFSPRWKYAESVSPDGSPIVLRRDPLAADRSEPMMVGVSPETGKSLWEVEAKAKNWGVPVRDDSNRLFVGLRGNGQEATMAVNGQDGTVLWTHSGKTWGQPQVMGDQLLVASRDSVTLLDSQTGEPAWSHSQRMTREPLITDESVVVATLRDDGIHGTRLSGLNPETGEVMWHYDTPHLTGVAQGPDGQLLHHAYKLDRDGYRRSYVHGLDNKTGEGLWHFEVGYRQIDGIGSDSEGRVTVAISNGGRNRELIVLDEGKEMWRQPVEGPSVAVVGNGDDMAVMDGQGITVVDAETGAEKGKVNIDSALANYDGTADESGRILMSGIDGEVVSLQMEGADQVMEPTSKTPGGIRHYRYDIAQNAEGNFYADVEADGEFRPGEDALLVQSVTKDDGSEMVHDPVTSADFNRWDEDGDGYLSKTEMNTAQLSLWWDRNSDGEVSSGDGLVKMPGEGRRQAVVDLNRQKFEVRNRRVGRR